MNQENTNRIIAACPSIFELIEEEQNKLIHSIESEDKTNVKPFHPIAFGFECGDGWADLLVELCQKFQNYLNTLPLDASKQIYVLQVKEKYGTLRFYLSHYDETMEKMISDAQKKSAITCETCGAPGKIVGTRWYYCACPAHTNPKDLES